MVEVKVSLVPTEHMPLRLGVAAGTCPTLTATLCHLNLRGFALQASPVPGRGSLGLPADVGAGPPPLKALLPFSACRKVKGGPGVAASPLLHQPPPREPLCPLLIQTERRVGGLRPASGPVGSRRNPSVHSLSLTQQAFVSTSSRPGSGSREHETEVPALLKLNMSVRGSSFKSNHLRNPHSDEWSRGSVRVRDQSPARPGILQGRDVCAGIWSRWHQRGSAGDQ